MAYRAFTRDEYEALANQHNIMVLVGNGFDIQVAHRYQSRFSPRYPSFYYYLASRDFDSSNLVVQQMAAAKETGRENWSDIESAIGHLLSPEGGWHSPEAVYEATVAVQTAFSEYLELVAPPGLLAQLGNDSANNSLAMTSMADLIGDVAARSPIFDSFTFPSETGHYDLYNFLFVNFNYTPLLDDYVFRDAQQFKPRAHTVADRNFTFRPNPTNHPRGSGNHETGWSSYVRSEVIHPHGQQAIPRSLLFGIDAPDGLDHGRDSRRKLMKPYWAMNQIEYGHLFPDTRLFIVFGCSLGESDGWWWRRVYSALNRQNDQGSPASELIIYWWTSDANPATRATVLDAFFAGVSATTGGVLQDRANVEPQIQVVVYTDQDPPVFLATP
ncbi:AbiH family protein [Nocardioides jiangxiensis]|uniref:AbiH family protein n=1 Tax=Nocardioides jiangxiensis TaxID=3064524 RepID=A0ABT9B0Z1_9ACTN|nr:AbiH family protein [Nocardioides sp. WY-20]MDO7868520.1 AbiH family protein [Nocardioides sp. WY-20]